MLFSTTSLHAASARDLPAEKKAVLAPLQSVLDGVAQRNHDLIHAQLLPGGMATLIREGKTLQLSWDAFLDRLPITGTTKLEEVMHHPIVHIDKDLAVIWTPYTFTIDGKLNHCGTDIATLIKQQDGRWLISGLSDNSRTSCTDK